MRSVPTECAAGCWSQLEESQTPRPVFFDLLTGWKEESLRAFCVYSLSIRPKILLSRTILTLTSRTERYAYQIAIIFCHFEAVFDYEEKEISEIES